MLPGIFIAVEGIDGAGKTTQVELLGRALRDAGETVVLSKEPTDGPWGRKVRESAKTGRLSLAEELEAFTEDRKQHVAELIVPAIEAGKVVILDRYYFSTIAYQGSRGLAVEELTQAMRAIAPLPDLTLLIDADPQVSLHRIRNHREEIPNHFEQHDALSAVRAIFKTLASDPKNQIVEINGMLPLDAVYREIANVLLDGPIKAKRCFKSYGCDGIYCSARETGHCRWAELSFALSR
jgi:dTMP kinase